MEYNKESFKKALKECGIVRWENHFEKVVKAYLKAEAEQLTISDVVGRSEQYHCELYDFGRKDKPCDKQCDGCKAMNLD
jgi:nitrogen regulatory protein PII